MPPLLAIRDLDRRRQLATEKTTAEEDRIDREGVLMFLLEQSGLVTIEEVLTYVLAYFEPERHAKARGGTERAIRDLVGAGVLNRVDESLYLSRAAREVADLIGA